MYRSKSVTEACIDVAGEIKCDRVSAAVAVQIPKWAWDLGSYQQLHPTFTMLKGCICRHFVGYT